eukprot:gene7924-8120_t
MEQTLNQFASPAKRRKTCSMEEESTRALYVTIPLLKSRSKVTTYQNLKRPVQNFCGRDFEICHIQQIKALSPDALGWQHILTTNPTTKKQEQQLLITMPRSGDDSKKSIDTMTLQQEFFQCLQQQRWLASSEQLPLAQLPPAAAPNARDCTPTRRSINPQMLPGTPQTAPPAASLSRTGDGSAASSTAHLMMSPPPPKRAALTVARSAAAGPGGLMSPPPARSRAGRARQPEAELSRGFTFSPVSRPPPLSALRPLAGLASSSTYGSPTNTHPDDSSSTPIKDLGTAVAAAEHHAQVNTPVLRPNKLFATPAVTATPQQVSATRPGRLPATPSTPATPLVQQPEQELRAQPAVAGVPAAGGVKVRKLTFDSEATTAAGRTGKAKTKAKAKASSVIDFELGESTMALLKHVTSSELQEEEAVQQQELDTRRALDMLQGSFDVLRAIFGDKGPCVKPRGEVSGHK